MSDSPHMQFAPLHGWLKNGRQERQAISGWMVLAHRPRTHGATPVVLLTLEDYQELKALAGVVEVATRIGDTDHEVSL